MFNVGDRVEILGNDGKWYSATVYNVNAYRPPESMYAVDIDGMEGEEAIFCGEEYLRKIEGENK